MPRTSAQRNLINETNVAARISLERQRRQLSYEALAQRMSDAGHPIQSTAIFKIEKGDPPRRITVDELVGFSKALDLTVDDLLTPLELVNQREAKSVLAAFERAADALAAAFEESLAAWESHASFFSRKQSDEVAEYLALQISALAWQPGSVGRAIGQRFSGKHAKAVSDLVTEGMRKITVAAQSVAAGKVFAELNPDRTIYREGVRRAQR